MPTRELAVRLSVKDHETVRRALEQLGDKGQAALRRIEKASLPASKGLLALNAASKEGQAALHGYAAQAGPMGAALSAIGPAGLAAAAGLTAVVGAGAALLSLAQHAAEVGDQFDKMSQRTGFSVELLSGLAFAAERSGASIESVEPSLVRLQRRMASAQTGAKEFGNAFAFLGIEIEQSNGRLRSAEDVFFDIADAVERAGESAETTNAITRVLGRSATGLIPLMKSGATGIRELLADAQRLGAVLSTEEAQKAAQYKDRLLDLETAFGGLQRELGNNLIPSLTEITEQLTELAASDGARETVEGIGKAVAFLADTTFRAVSGLMAMKRWVQDLDATLTGGHFFDALTLMGLRALPGGSLLQTGGALLGEHDPQGAPPSLREEPLPFGDKTSLTIAAPDAAVLERLDRTLNRMVSATSDATRAIPFGEHDPQGAPPSPRPSSSSEAFRRTSGPTLELGPEAKRILGGLALRQSSAQAHAFSQRGPETDGFKTAIEARLGDIDRLFEALETPLQELNVPVDELDETLGGLHRNFQTSVQIAEKKRQVDLLAMDSEEARALATLRWQQVQEEIQLSLEGATQKQIEALKELQAQERSLIGKRFQTSEDELRAKRDQATGLFGLEKLLYLPSDTVRQIEQVSTVFTRLVPNMENFARAGIQVLEGEFFDAAISGIHGFLDVLGLAGDEHARLSRQLLETTREIQDAVGRLASSASLQSAVGQEILTAQRQAVDPILKVFDQIRSEEVPQAGPLSVFEQLDNLTREFAKVGQGRSGRVLDELGLTVGGFFRQIDLAFGKDVDFLTDVVPRIFSIRDAFDGLTDAAGKLSAVMLPLERAIRAQFDTQEIQLRAQAARDFQRVGPDSFAQAQVTENLFRAIDALASAEQAELLRLRQSGGTLTSAGKLAAGAVYQRPGGASIDNVFAGALGLDSTEIPTSEVFDLRPSPLADFGVETTGDFFDLSRDLPKFTRDWHQFLRMERSPLWLFRVYTAAGFFDMSRDLPKFTRDWHQFMEMSASPLAAFDVTQAEHLFNMAAELAKIPRKWHQFMEMSPSTLAEFGIENAEDFLKLNKRLEFKISADAAPNFVFEDDIDRLSGGLARAWSQFLTMTKSPLSAFGIEKVEDFFDMPETLIPWTLIGEEVIKIIPRTFNSADKWTELLNGGIIAQEIPLVFKGEKMITFEQRTFNKPEDWTQLVNGGIIAQEIPLNFIGEKMITFEPRTFKERSDWTKLVDGPLIAQEVSLLFEGEKMVEFTPRTINDAAVLFKLDNLQLDFAAHLFPLMDLVGDLHDTLGNFVAQDPVSLGGTDLFKIDKTHRITLGIWDVIDFWKSDIIVSAYTGRPLITLQPDRLFQIGDHRIKIKPEDIFDMDALGRIIDARITRSQRDRRLAS